MKAVVLGGVSCLALILGSLAGQARAAEGDSGAAPAAATAIKEIIVTAQKREQRLQDVPVAVTVLDKARLRQAGVRSLKDLTLLTPGLNATANGDEATTTFRIRGVGAVADNPGLEDPVAVYIDGVYRPRNGVSFNNLGELSDVEVLKGPQGSLFGENAVAGVVQVTTERPSFAFGAEAEASVQNYNGYSGSASVTGPLVKDVLAARLYFADSQRDGYVPVVSATPQPAQYDEHVYTVRGQLLYRPTAELDVALIADYTRRDDHCCAAVDYLNGFGAALQEIVAPGSIPDPVGPTNATAYLNESPQEHIREGGLSAEVHWTTPWFNHARLTSITAWRDWRDRTASDIDYTAADLLVLPAGNRQEFTQVSEELRYAGEAGRLSWLVGGLYTHEDLDYDYALVWGADAGPYFAFLTTPFGPLATGTYPGAFPAGAGQFDHYRHHQESGAIYTQDDIRLTDRLTLTGGVRYTVEHKALRSAYNVVDPSNSCGHFEAVAGQLHLPPIKAYLGLQCLFDPAFAGLTTNQSFTEGAVTGTVKLSYRFDDRNMVYASYSRGNLAAGFNMAEVTTAVGLVPNASLAPQADTYFPAEDVDAFEIGAKSQLLDRRLLVTVAAFYQTYTRFQLNLFTGTQFIEETVPEARSAGVEVESYFRASPSLTLDFAATYADTEYPDSAANQAVLGNNTPGSPLYQATPLFNLPGSRLSFAPLWSLAGGVQYRHALAGPLVWTASFDGKYQSSYNAGSDHDPVKLQPAYAVFNARLGVGSADGRWALEVWANNIFNQFYDQTRLDGSLQVLSQPWPASVSSANNYYAFPGVPRMFGVTIRAKY